LIPPAKATSLTRTLRTLQICLLLAFVPSLSAPLRAGDAQPADEGKTLEPRIDVLLPEGDFDLRLGRFVKNSLFEGQFKYNFPKGDITAFLRYRYYARSRTFTLGVFDSLEYDAVEKLSNDFTRVRGLLLLAQQPATFHRRAFGLIEVDRLSTDKEELRYSNDRTNIFARLGYQIGTPRDDRSNAVAGESRARVQRLFSAHRDIGPRGAGATAALTYGFDWAGGDFDYVKVEFDALKRTNLPRGLFLVQRLHGGSFLSKQRVRSGPETQPADEYSIPRAELFRLDGRENLKGLDERLRGTDNLMSTAEFFVPWFVDGLRRGLGLDWESWYWVAYAGAGAIGFDPSVLGDGSEYRVDVGLGFESSFRWRGYTVFTGAVIAQTLSDRAQPKARVSLKTFR
jgi:hypothetical protein